MEVSAEFCLEVLGSFNPETQGEVEAKVTSSTEGTGGKYPQNLCKFFCVSFFYCFPTTVVFFVYIKFTHRLKCKEVHAEYTEIDQQECAFQDSCIVHYYMLLNKHLF